MLGDGVTGSPDPLASMNRTARYAPALLLAAISFAAKDPPSPVEAVVLGIAQDGGIPQVNCHAYCEEVRKDPSKRRLLAALRLIGHAAGKRFFIHPAPKFGAQVPRPGRPPVALPF